MFHDFGPNSSEVRKSESQGLVKLVRREANFVYKNDRFPSVCWNWFLQLLIGFVKTCGWVPEPSDCFPKCSD